MKSRPILVALVLAVSVSSQAPSWAPLSTAVTPPTRMSHGMACDEGRARTVVFGGWDLVSYVDLADTWEFDGTTWSSMTPVSSPLPRRNHAMAYVPANGTVVLFGGYVSPTPPNNLGGVLGDTWEWDGVNWNMRAPTQFPVPSNRQHTALATDWSSGRVVMFGGSNAPYTSLADAWEWDGVNWTQIAGGPPARSAHAMVQDRARGKIVMFGGFGTVRLDDTWEFDGVSWQQVSPPNRPIARWGHRMAYDVATGRLLMHGGSILVPPWASDETWQWDGAAWTLIATTPALATFDHVLAFDSATSRIMLFGGAWYQSVHQFVTAAPADAVVFGAPCPGPLGPTWLRARPGSLPWIGQTLDLVLDPVPGFVLVAFGWSNTTVGTTPLPFALAPYGAPGCDVLVSPDAVVGVAGSSTVTVQVALPSSPALVGIQFFAQGFVPDPAANPLGATTSNGVAATVGW